MISVDIIAHLRNVAHMRKDKFIELDDFAGWGASLRRAFKAASKAERKASELGNQLPPSATEYGALRYHCYGYMWRLAQADLLDDLCAHFGIRPGPKSATYGACVLRLIDEGKKPELVTPTKRSRTGKELDFALLHKVSPERVLGFLYEVGNQSEIVRMFDEDEVPEAAARYRHSNTSDGSGGG